MADPPTEQAAGDAGERGREAVVPNVEGELQIAKQAEHRVGLNIVFEPTVRTEPCLCGRTFDSQHPVALARARAGKELRVECKCGRVLVAQQGLVEVVKRPKLVTVGGRG
jgi:hypothetical protein